jgi:hypothetical protein
VKVARKRSRSNVLGKASKPEHRSRAEQASLKSLIGGLVGGPALVEEWEREWKMKFGREEQDEVEREDGSDEDSEDEEGEEEELGKKRKRAKTSPTPKVSFATAAVDRATKKSVSLVLCTSDQVPEEKRPRKVYHRRLCLLARPPDFTHHQAG